MKRLLVLTGVTLVALAAPAQAAPNPNPNAAANGQGCQAVLAALAGDAAASLERDERGLANFIRVGQAFGCE